MFTQNIEQLSNKRPTISIRERHVWECTLSNREVENKKVDWTCWTVEGQYKGDDSKMMLRQDVYLKVVKI